MPSGSGKRRRWRHEADRVVVADDVVVNVARRSRHAVIRRAAGCRLRIDGAGLEIAERVDVEQAFAEERARYCGRACVVVTVSESSSGVTRRSDGERRVSERACSASVGRTVTSTVTCSVSPPVRAAVFVQVNPREERRTHRLAYTSALTPGARDRVNRRGPGSRVHRVGDRPAPMATATPAGFVYVSVYVIVPPPLLTVDVPAFTNAVSMLMTLMRSCRCCRLLRNLALASSTVPHTSSAGHARCTGGRVPRSPGG